MNLPAFFPATPTKAGEGGSRCKRALTGHIATLRKRKGLSQSDLGKAVNTSGDIIGKYERDEVKPSIEVASKIADALDVGLDFLLGKTTAVLDKKTLDRLQEIQKLPEDERKVIYKVLDSLLCDAKAKQAYA